MNKNLDIKSIFEELVGTTTAPIKKPTRTVNGTTYFFSKWSQSWHPESKRSGKHNYSKDEINIWSRVYRAVQQQRATVAELKLQNKTEEAAILERKLDELWKAKDSSPELYKDVRGLTTEELDALEADSKKAANKAAK